jgi:nicotinate dehydrogenase subunit A
VVVERALDLGAIGLRIDAKQVLDVDPLDRQHTAFELDFARRLTDEPAFIRGDMTRLQRASKGAGQSACGCGDDVVERRRVLLVGPGDAVVLGDRAVEAEAHRPGFAREMGEPNPVADPLDAHVRDVFQVAHGTPYPRLRALVESIPLRVNGTERVVHVEPDTPLLYVLRNDLGLTAAKFGCGLEQCHACAVIVDGDAVTSCATAVETFVGKEITTLEGLGTPERLHPVQQAFLDEEAGQCGYCIPGMIVAAAALLDVNPGPSDVEIRAALADNLCRCGSHPRIVDAVRTAAGS